MSIELAFQYLVGGAAGALWLGLLFELLEIDPAEEREQIASLTRIKQDRSSQDVQRTLDAVRRAAEAGQNLMPSLLDAARARITVGETMRALAEVLGRQEGVPGG